ncbi:MAG: SNF2-related protein, partial [Nitriliruptoraceae bacterium]
TAGVIVDVPPELRRDAIERVGLRLRIGRTVDADVDDVASLNLQSIVSGAYELVVGDEPLTADEFTTLTAGTHPLVKWRGRWVRVDSDVTAAAAATAGQVTSLTLTEALMSALTGRLDVDGIGTVATRATGDVAELIGRLRSSPRPEDARVVGFVGELRDYQRRGVAWLQALAELGIGGVLADEMGLGKTVQAIALLASRQGDRPHLVVCPTSVVGNWERELARFAPDLPVIRHHGVDRQISRSVMRPGRVIVTSFALLRRDQHLFGDIAWDVVVFDEAQQIKNAVSKTARAARTLDSRVRIAMTGTPLENRLAELWAIIDVTNPGLLGSRRTFDARFAAPIERWHDDAAAERLRRLIAPFVLRRRKDDAEVSVSLPPKQELTETCGLTREQAQLYRTVIDETFTGGLSSATFERRGQVLALLTALKQICNHPEHYLQEGGPLPGRSGKLLRFTELIEEIVADDASVLVFTQFRRMGDLLAKHLSETLGLTDVPFLHGGVPLRAREAMVDRFQLDPTSPPVLLVSLRAGGTGLNLTRATHVVHVDRWWNPAVEDQATDRAHRIGQEQRVTVHTMVTAGTIESRIADLLERKRSLADAVVGTGEAWISDLDDDELHELVALSTDEFVDEDDDQRVSAAEPQRPRLVVVDGGRS